MNTRAITLILAFAAAVLVLPSASAATTITSSALDHIVVQPNDRPTVIDIETDQQFIATGYTKDEIALSGLTFHWTSDGDVGIITADGMFTGTRGGIGRVIARNGQITASVGVVVRGVAKATPPAAPTSTPSSSTTVQPVVTNTNETVNSNTNDDGAVKGDSVEETPAVASETTTPCTTIRAWLWLIVLALYCIVLFAYFLSLGESRTLWWWIWPALLTAAPFVLYFGTRCGNTHIWVPWTLGILAILLTVFYLRVLRPANPAQPIQRP